MDLLWFRNVRVFVGFLGINPWKWIWMINDVEVDSRMCLGCRNFSKWLRLGLVSMLDQFGVQDSIAIFGHFAGANRFGPLGESIRIDAEHQVLVPESIRIKTESIRHMQNLKFVVRTDSLSERIDSLGRTDSALRANRFGTCCFGSFSF